jgi:hypothetical protein
MATGDVIGLHSDYERNRILPGAMAIIIQYSLHVSLT